MSNRIQFLDGFRGLAIILVVFFHTFTIHNDVLPFSSVSNFPVFKYGYLGVELFFMISGFVILMTLEKTEGFINFMKKRWVRLFPAMLIATVFTYCIGQIIRQDKDLPTLISTIPGLMFLEPKWLSTILRTETGLLEGSFWSLFVEMKFYFIFGLLYYIFNKFVAIGGIFLLYILSLFVEILSFFGHPIYILLKGAHAFSLIYFGWFSAGAIMYVYFQKKDKKYLIVAIFVSLLSIFSQGLDSGLKLFMSFLIPFVFISTIYFESLKKLFNNKLFLFIGFISYPLYLIHESNMVALMVLEKKWGGVDVPAIILPVFPWLFVIVVAYAITKYIEPPLHNFIRNLIFTK